MQQTVRTPSPKRVTSATYVTGLIIFWTAAVGASLWFNVERTRNYALESARIQARTAFEKDLVYRRWNSMFGGIYAAVSPQTPPNPYLQDPYRDITTPGGKFTKINPAYMTRLVHELGELSSGIRGHITSNMPIRPQNAPDPWEAKALRRLEAYEEKEVSDLQTMDGKLYMRLIRPLVTEQSCMPCHAFQGYAIGQLRGGISISVPMQPIMASADSTVRMLLYSHGGLWVFGLLASLAGGRHLGNRIRERDEAEKRLRNLTEELEHRVMERTKDLRRRQQELQTFMDNTDAGVYLKNTQHAYVLANRRFAALLNTSPEFMHGREDKQLLPKELAEHLYSCEKKALRKNSVVALEDFPLEGQEGRMFSGSVFPALDAEGALEGVGGIIVDVTERNHMEEALRGARDEAESASRAKSDFLANISHEIRTPLNGVIGMADLLLRTQLNPDQSSMAATVKTAGGSLLCVLNDILDFSKIEAGKMYLDLQPFSLRDTFFDAVRGLAPVAHKKRLEMIVHIAPQVPDHVVGDSTRIRQVVLNLVGNAIKFTEKGEITLTVRTLSQDNSKTRLRVSVTDTGIGISTDKQQRIFSAFEQGDSSTTRKYGGTGLGLAISGKLLALMGTRLFLESQPGYGSTFWFDLELPYLCDMSPPKPLLSVQAMENVRVLVVDDNAANRRIFMEQLSAWGMKPRESADADEALRLLRAAVDSPAPFDLVLSDLQMPGKDGLALLANIRADDMLRGVPLILLSSGDLPESAYTEPQFQANLTKPVRPEELMRAMTTALGLWESFGIDQFQARAEEEATRTSGARLKILLAEDMEMNQLVASRMLQDLGHTVRIAGNGQQALNMLANEPFDIVFMDIQMPVMDGIQAVETIRSREADAPGAPHVPVIAMTAHAFKGDKEKYMLQGMDAHIAKPVLLNELARVIEEVVERFAIAQTAKEAESPLKDITGYAGPPVAADTGQLFDHNVMRQSFAGNIDLIAQSMRLYLHDAPSLLQEADAAISRGDNGALTVSAHALKGITGYYTKGELFALCLAMEQMGRNNALPQGKVDATRQLARLQDQIEKLLNDMRQYLDAHATG